MKRVRTTLALLLGALLLLLSGCARREPVRALTCVQPDTLPGLCAAGGANVAVCRTDYEAQRTTVQLVDTAGDTVRGARTLDGAWELPGQTFSGGGFALRCRATGTWLLLDADLADAGTLEAEDMDGFFSRDAGTYYYLSDHMLCSRDVATGVSGRVPLAQELRLAQLAAFDGRRGRARCAALDAFRRQPCRRVLRRQLRPRQRAGGSRAHHGIFHGARRRGTGAHRRAGHPREARLDVPRRARLL